MLAKQILELLPSDPSGVAVSGVVIVGIGVGLVTCLLGAAKTRATITLLMAALGAAIAYLLPRGLELGEPNPIITCLATALFALFGYSSNRLCVALFFGLLLTGIALAATYDQPAPIDKATTQRVQLSPTLANAIPAAWQSATPEFRSASRWLIPTVFLITGVLTYIFHRLGTAALYSVGGTLLVFGSVWLGLASDEIRWLEPLRVGPMTTALFAFCLLLVGFVTQMVLIYRDSRQMPIEPPEASTQLPV